MYAIAFDLNISEVKTYYNINYNNAYFEIKKILKKYGFQWIQGSTYASKENDLLKITQVITALKSVDWFVRSVRDIRVFKMEDYSDFTSFFRSV